MTILDTIVADTRIRTEAEKRTRSLDEVIEACGNAGKKASFADALKEDGLSLICEVKKASPSKGIIAEDFPYMVIAKEYERVGASAISVLTEPDHFKGSDKYLEEIARNVNIPLLRKDFVIDEYQVYRAKEMGASAVLLIAAVLDDDSLAGFGKLAKDLGLSALVETHDKNEVERAISCGAEIIGVNNRDLRNFTVDINNSIRLSKYIPDDVIRVSESGIKGKDETRRLMDAGFDAVLIGETLMRSKDKKKTVSELKG